MKLNSLACWLLGVVTAPWLAAQETPAPTAASSPERRAVAYVIPVHEQIGKPTLYIIRRGLKEAIEQKADLVVLDMKTPGGDAGTTVEIMEALERFEGATVTFVNDEAGSAGAIIASVTDDIYFAPTGVMGAAELILGTGEDAPEALKRKMESYIRAKSRALSGGDERRADVLKAMMSSDFELKIGDKVLKPKGELLTLSAQEAVKPYGEPPTPLLAAGIAKDIDGLLTKRFGAGKFEVRKFRVTWSESLAQYLTAFAPVLMGLGMLALFLEYKTPGFGWPGVLGITLLAIVFFGHYIAGLSGHEPALMFVIGALLLAVELFLLPGVILPGLIGVGLMLGALVWAMTDVWPDQPLHLSFSGDAMLRPLLNLGGALVLAGAGAALLLKYLPNISLLRSIAVGGDDTPLVPQADGTGLSNDRETLVGQTGRVAVALRPVGVIEISGRRYEASVEVGEVPVGKTVRVVASRDFSLLVEKIS